MTKRTVKKGFYRRSFERLYASGNWFQFPRQLPLIMKPQECILFAYLADLSFRFQHSDKTFTPEGLNKEDGWFRCPIDWIERDLGWSLQLANKWMLVMEAQGYLERARAGVGACRYLRLMYEKVEAKIDEMDNEYDRLLEEFG